MILSQGNLQGLFFSYSVAFNKAFSEAKVNYTKVAMIINSTTKDTTYAWMGQLPSMREWIGSRVIQNLTAYDYTIKNRTFELTTCIPVNDIADDQYGIYAPIFQEMGIESQKHPDLLLFKLMGEGFVEKCYDNVPFFSDNHPLGENMVQSNIGTKKLSAASYAEASCKMMTIKGEEGRSLNIVPDLLVVAPQNGALARELLYADQIAGSSNVNKNTCDLLIVPELADYPDQWYLLCTQRPVKPFVFQRRETPKLICKNKENDDNVFFDDEVIYGVKARYNVGFGLWQLAYGSTGTDGATTTGTDDATTIENKTLTEETVTEDAETNAKG